MVDFKKVFAGLLLVGVVVFAAWKVLGNKQNKVQYQTVKVTRGTLVVSVAVSGQVAVAGRFPVSSTAVGQIKEVLVKNGDQITAGQKILSLTLDSATANKNAAAYSSYLSANATFYSLQSTMFTKWKTFKDLAESSSYDSPEERALPQFHIAEKDWLKAEADYKNQQAAVNAAWQSYQQTSPDLISPVAGTVADLIYVPGMLVTNPTISIINASPVAVMVNLSEADVNKINQENEATVTFDALPEKTFDGKVAGVNKTGIVTSGVTNYPATIQLDTTPPEILPNMSASANIVVATKKNVLLVPSEAVQDKKIKILKNNQVKFTPVKTGLSSDTQTEIISGVNEGEEIITGTTTNTSPPAGTSPFSTFRFGGTGETPRR